MKKFFAAAVSVTLALSLAGCGSNTSPSTAETVEAEKAEEFTPVKLKFANQHPVDSIASQTDQAICDAIGEATEGRVTVELYTDSSLGDYTSVFDEVMVGSIDMAHTTPVETYDGRMSASMLPYLGPSYEALEKAYSPDNYLYQQISEVSEKLGLHFFGFFCEGYNGIGTKSELTNPAVAGEDKGVVVRSPGAIIYSEGAKGLGFRTSSIAYSDTYTAIQTGVVDGWLGGPANLNYLYFRDVINNFYNYQYNQESTLIYMNEKTFRSLLPEDQEAIEKIIREACAGSIKTAEEDDEKYRNLLEEEGITVVNFTDEERAAFADYIRTNVWPKFAENTSEEFINNIIESMK